MSLTLLWAFRRASLALDRAVCFALFGGNRPQLALAALDPAPSPGALPEEDPLSSGFSGFLWSANGAAPKQRKSMDRRKSVPFQGSTWGTQKIMKPNRRIRVDNETGEFFELGKLAPKAYR